MDHGVKWSLQDNQNVSLLWAVIPTGQQMHMFVSNKIVDDVGGLVVVVCKFPKNVLLLLLLPYSSHSQQADY